MDHIDKNLLYVFCTYLLSFCLQDLANNGWS